MKLPPALLLVLGQAFALANAAAGPQTTATVPRLDRNQLLVYRDRLGLPQPVKSVRDWEKRRAETVRAMESVMGPLPGRSKRCPLEPRTEQEFDRGACVCRIITYASEPNCRVPAWLLIPRTALHKRVS